jgi:hypothetical protein
LLRSLCFGRFGVCLCPRLGVCRTLWLGACRSRPLRVCCGHCIRRRVLRHRDRHYARDHARRNARIAAMAYARNALSVRLAPPREPVKDAASRLAALGPVGQSLTAPRAGSADGQGRSGCPDPAEQNSTTTTSTTTWPTSGVPKASPPRRVPTPSEPAGRRNPAWRGRSRPISSPARPPWNRENRDVPLRAGEGTRGVHRQPVTAARLRSAPLTFRDASRFRGRPGHRADASDALFAPW